MLSTWLLRYTDFLILYTQTIAARVSKRNLIIAIDGPAGSGKSTTARLVAERLGLLHVDTGAMYRAFTLKVLESGIDPGDVERVSALVEHTAVELQKEGSRLRVLLDGRDVTERIRLADVTKAVSAVSSVAMVRKAMVKQQRAMSAAQGVVLEGRDIGTVVFPDADVKVYLIASLEARAKRRHLELKERGVDVAASVLEQEIAERDRLDSTRNESPLKQADDAIEIDTSLLTVDEQVSLVVARANEVLRMKRGA